MHIPRTLSSLWIFPQRRLQFSVSHTSSSTTYTVFLTSQTFLSVEVSIFVKLRAIEERFFILNRLRLLEEDYFLFGGLRSLFLVVYTTSTSGATGS